MHDGGWEVDLKIVNTMSREQCQGLRGISPLETLDNIRGDLENGFSTEPNKGCFSISNACLL